MIKKGFISLCVGLGATLGISITLAMPPGGWAILMGVLVGMLSCVFVLLGVFITLRWGGRGGRRDYDNSESSVRVGRGGGGGGGGYRGRTALAAPNGNGPVVLLVTPDMLGLGRPTTNPTSPRTSTNPSFGFANPYPASLPSLADFDKVSIIEGQVRPTNQSNDYFWE